MSYLWHNKVLWCHEQEVTLNFLCQVTHSQLTQRCTDVIVLLCLLQLKHCVLLSPVIVLWDSVYCWVNIYWYLYHSNLCTVYYLSTRSLVYHRKKVFIVLSAYFCCYFLPGALAIPLKVHFSEFWFIFGSFLILFYFVGFLGK